MVTPSIELCRLVYTSHNRISGSDSEVESKVHSILHTAQIRNKAMGLTGALFFSENKFAQILEGHPATVANTYFKILGDPRHDRVCLLALEPIEERTFAQWYMGYVGSSNALTERFVEAFTQPVKEIEFFGHTQVAELVEKHLDLRAVR